MNINAVLFDLIGTTVIEKDPLTITNCFINSFSKCGIKIGVELVRKNRGKDKAEIVANILTESGYSLNLKDAILRDYKVNLECSIDNFYEDEHLRDITGYLKRRGIKIGVGTGLSRDFFDKIMEHLNWESIGFDYTGTSEETGSGRPDPGMIFDMMKKFNLNRNKFLKVGDTVVDIQEGKNAKVLTAAILTGTQSNDNLINEKPDFVIRSLMELREIVK